ncbi:MAG: ribosome-associated heat shock protein Hsp15 [Tenericutes bacterium ADurb.Bin239]|jgi:ribosomal 50S subunit-recycling heat shock protein|nr:MAG: ribosome-associated heat shock protein Hsp15 [Tenericutes bacterium ADurb.Bin239]
MRLDKFLKLTRLIKRRTIAKDISIAGKVIVDKRTVKPSYNVKVNDILELYLGEYIVMVKVLTIDEKELRSDPQKGYELLSRTTNAN